MAFAETSHPGDRTTVAPLSRPEHDPALARSVSIFWDGSNIFFPAREVAIDREGPYQAPNIRIQVDHMYELARAQRSVERAVYVASVDPKHAILDKLRACGMDLDVFEVGERSGREQAVDQALQVHMLRAITDLRPGVAVLLTGDGAGAEDGRGYFADLQRMHAFGWAIEVITWKAACHRRMRKWVEAHGRMIFLDDYYDSVTFLEGARRSKPLPTHAFRRAATPAPPRLGRFDVVEEPAQPVALGTASDTLTSASVPTPAPEAPMVAASAVDRAPDVLPVAVHVPIALEQKPKARYRVRTTTPASRDVAKRQRPPAAPSRASDRQDAPAKRARARAVRSVKRRARPSWGPGVTRRLARWGMVGLAIITTAMMAALAAFKFPQ
jgi:hypothetical protein